MPDPASILLVDGSDERMKALADRLRLLDFRVVRAKTPEEAFRLVEDPRFTVSVVGIPPELTVADLPEALAALRARARGGELAYLAMGPRPDPATLERLRAARVRLALWEPFDDGALRFQANRALAGLRELAPRSAIRVPVELAVQVWAAGRRKGATTYTLSAAGAFLETPRPSPFGAEVAVELPLAAARLPLTGRVVYTNVPGNLRKRSLPVGMAVAFTAMSEDVEQAIRQRVAQTLPSLGI